MIPSTQKSIIKRNSSVANTFQAGIDGLTLIILALGLIKYRIGVLTPEYVVMLLLLLGILAIAFDRYAIYRRTASFTFKAIDLAKAWTLSFFVLILIGFVSKQGEFYSRLLIGTLFVTGLSAHILLHLVFYYLQKSWFSQAHKDCALIIGEGDLANFLWSKINQSPWMGQEVVGAISLDSPEPSGASESSQDKLKVLGGISDLAGIIDQHDVSTVYIVTPLQSSKLLEEVYFTLLDNHIAVHWIPDIFSLRLVNHSVNEIAGIPVLTLSETPLTGTRLLAKSLEDKILSLAILLLVSPLMLLIALAIKLDSPGPVFFRQPRGGWNGEVFHIWKFRTMVVHDPEGEVIEQARKGDSRVTRVGALLRRTSLDELPQLLNVLVGDMSLVGPRPHALQHDQDYSQHITDYYARHHIKPGITGLAQVRGFRGETGDMNLMMQRIESDIEYINNWSVWLDFTILLRTTAALTGKYAY